MIATPAVIDLESVINESPASFNTADELIRSLRQAGSSTNRCALYTCYLYGKAADKTMLQLKYGITVTDLAKALGISRASLYNYRTIAEMFTVNEIKSFAAGNVPVKALLIVSEAKNTLGDDAAEKLKSALLFGNFKALKGVQDEYKQMLEDSLASHNMLPGGEPPEQEDLLLEEPDNDVIDVTPADAIIDAEEVTEGDDEDYKDESTSLNEKDAKTALKLVKQASGSLVKNYLDISNNAEEQVAKALEKQNIVIDTTQEEEFDRLMHELCESNQATLETCLKVHKVFRDYGFVRRKTETPENISIEDLLSNQNREESC
jgi:hypothetical protein